MTTINDQRTRAWSHK